MADADEMVAQFRDLKELADNGNTIAGKVIAWFDQPSNQAGIAGCYPPDRAESIKLMADAGHTCELFWGARLLRWQIDHPGLIPTHYSFVVDLEFDTVE